MDAEHNIYFVMIVRSLYTEQIEPCEKFIDVYIADDNVQARTFESSYSTFQNVTAMISTNLHSEVYSKRKIISRCH